MTARVVLLVRGVAAASDELWVVAGAAAVIVGVALIYTPAAVILAGLLLVLIGVGRMRT